MEEAPLGERLSRCQAELARFEDDSAQRCVDLAATLGALEAVCASTTTTT